MRCPVIGKCWKMGEWPWDAPCICPQNFYQSPLCIPQYTLDGHICIYRWPLLCCKCCPCPWELPIILYLSCCPSNEPLLQLSYKYFWNFHWVLWNMGPLWKCCCFYLCPCRVDVNVSLLLAELIVHFCLESVENSVRVIASAECHMDVLAFLVQQLLVGVNISGPVWKCVVDTICWWCWDDCPSVDTDLCLWIFCRLFWLVFHMGLEELRCPRKGVNHVGLGSQLWTVCGVKGLRWDMNYCVCSALQITNVSFTNLCQIPGGLGEELKALAS